MTATVAQLRIEYQFMQFLNWLDTYLKERLDYVFLVMVFGALALLLWWRLRRRARVHPGSGKVDMPQTGIFDFLRTPGPMAGREPRPETPCQPAVCCHSDGES